MDSINSLNGKLGTEFEIALTDRGQLDFHEFSMHKRKKIYAKFLLSLTLNFEY